MNFLICLYLLTTQASLFAFLLAGLWGSILSIGNKSLGSTYKSLLLGSQLILTASCVLLTVLGLTHTMPNPQLNFIYSLVALAILPCIYSYLPKDQMRYLSTSIAISCMFISGVVMRLLQVFYD